MAERVQISHYYTTGNSMPDLEKLTYGELALSLSAGSESIYFKNTNDNIATFSSDNKFLSQNNSFTGTTTFNNNAIFNNTTNLNSYTYISGEMTFNRGGGNIIATNGLNITGSPININGAISTTGVTSIIGNTNISGNTTITGTCTSTGGFYDTSDERLKTFGENINVDLDKIKDIKKSYFHYKYDEKREKHIGVSAQDVERLYPEITNINEDGYLTVDYSKLSVIALKAIDVLSEENKILKTKLTDLEKRLELLENK